jgi:hypothetical protein
MNNLAVFTFWQDLPQSVVPVLNYVQKFRIFNYPYPRVLFRVGARDLQRFVGTAVVNDEIFPVRVCLAQHAFDTLPQIFLRVVHRGYNTDQWLKCRIQRYPSPLSDAFLTERHSLSYPVFTSHFPINRINPGIPHPNHISVGFFTLNALALLIVIRSAPV